MSLRAFALGLLLAVVASALLVVYAVHRNRVQFVALQQAQEQRDELNVEWGQLQLEESAWGTQARVEQVARKKLDMRMPRQKEIVVIRP
jgi:cell division protein FtsL